jgi:hypothetical protein
MEIQFTKSLIPSGVSDTKDGSAVVAQNEVVWQLAINDRILKIPRGPVHIPEGLGAGYHQAVGK